MTPCDLCGYNTDYLYTIYKKDYCQIVKGNIISGMLSVCRECYEEYQQKSADIEIARRYG